MIEAEEVKNRRVQIMNMHAVFDGGEAEFVGRAVDVAGFHAAAGHPHGETVVVVVAPVHLPGIRAGSGKLDGGRAAEFAAPDDERFVKHAEPLQVFQKRRDGLVAFTGETSVFFLDFVMAVPWLPLAVPQLHEADAAFEEPAGDEQLAGLHAVAVGFPHVRRFAVDVEGFAGLGLHAKRQFERLNARVEIGLALSFFKMFAVEVGEQVELVALARVPAARFLMWAISFSISVNWVSM